MGGEILSALQDAAQAHPEKAMDVLDELKTKWAGLSDDDKAKVKVQLQALKEKAASMSPEQRTQIADKIRDVAGV